MIIIPWMQRRSNIWKEINAICHINTHKGKIYFFQKRRCGIWQKTISIHDKNLYQLKNCSLSDKEYLQVKYIAAYIILIGKLLNTFSVESGKVGMYHINASIWCCTAQLQCNKKMKDMKTEEEIRSVIFALGMFLNIENSKAVKAEYAD